MHQRVVTKTLLNMGKRKITRVEGALLSILVHRASTAVKSSSQTNSKAIRQILIRGSIQLFGQVDLEGS